jgi:hypothetical protein
MDSLPIPLPTWAGLPQWLLPAALLALGLLLVWLLLGRRGPHRPIGALLGTLGSDSSGVNVFLRGLFVPGNEFFTRAPADPRNPSAGITVHKWGKIPEAYSASDVQALTALLQVLVTVGRRISLTLLSGEPSRQAWGTDAVAIGPHYMSLQILDTCEPRLIAVRQPAAFRGLVSQELFEAKEGLDYGLIYKGRHPATHRVFFVVMGLGDPGTAAAGEFLRAHAGSLGRLVGTGAFAAVIAVDTAPERSGQPGILRSLQPRPPWWRRLFHRRLWRDLTAPPTAPA